MVSSHFKIREKKKTFLQMTVIPLKKSVFILVRVEFTNHMRQGIETVFFFFHSILSLKAEKNIIRLGVSDSRKAFKSDFFNYFFPG